MLPSSVMPLAFTHLLPESGSVRKSEIAAKRRDDGADRHADDVVSAIRVIVIFVVLRRILNLYGIFEPGGFKRLVPSQHAFSDRLAVLRRGSRGRWSTRSA